MSFVWQFVFNIRLRLFHYEMCGEGTYFNTTPYKISIFLTHIQYFICYPHSTFFMTPYSTSKPHTIFTPTFCTPYNVLHVPHTADCYPYNMLSSITTFLPLYATTIKCLLFKQNVLPILPHSIFCPDPKPFLDFFSP